MFDLSWFGRIRISDNFHFEGRFGYALGREYMQYTEDQKVPFRIALLDFYGDQPERVHKNYLFDPGLVVNLRVVYDLSL
ncbi:hypothetical protein LCGC14_1779100 [marine sediment metagenome]|uniref:Uncharacterized protein n=1 Tax=marine sediment metagenome TaxID=412755 RepID=A0A0F9JAV8_9ZZZZ|nr:hypothetical protein [Bacteroides sp.]